MKSFELHIRPYGQYAVLIEWPEQVDPAILDDMLRLKTVLLKSGFTAPEWDLVPAYRSMALISNEKVVDPESLTRQILQIYSKKRKVKRVTRYLWHLPVCYTEEFGPDLEELTQTLGLSRDELVAQHTAQNYTVYGIGFLPGFMYLGGLPESLETDRRAEPRLKVNKGSIGLAGKQTGIYPQDSPGGWNIIGNCPIPIFSLVVDPPCFVSVGDQIRFYSVSRGEYELRKIEADVGVFNLKKDVLHDSGN